jgi:hypothetical protein
VFKYRDFVLIYDTLEEIKAMVLKIIQKCTFLLTVFLTLISGLDAQTKFPVNNFWSLDAGFGMNDVLLEGQSYQFILDPKMWLSQPLMIGSRIGVSYSTDAESRSLAAFEGQIYLRWNFLRLGKNPEKEVNIFIQGGLGLIAIYRGIDNNPFGDPTQTRGSVMADAAAGVTIPINPRWHIEPSVRGGYPHLLGGGITAGYKFPMPRNGE